jgi:alpha-L-rhamnosidase
MLETAFPAAPTINPALLTRFWPASWCRHPDGPRQDSAVFLYRKTISLAEKPERFVVHLTADQRYRLWVNGQSVCFGPQRGDTLHWHYESIDIAPFLTDGENTLTVQVHYFDTRIGPVFQMTVEAGLVVQGDGEVEAVVNTPKGWKVHRDDAYSFSTEEAASLWTYCVVGPSETLDGAKHPWNWQQSNFDDSAWPEAVSIVRAVPYGASNAETYWWLTPRTLPLMEETPQQFGKVVRAEGITVPNDFLADSSPLTIPAHTNAVILLDQNLLTTAFPEIVASGGEGATLRLAYAESLMDGSRKPNDHGRKGNRNETEGKILHGYSDTWKLDGGDSRVLHTLWWRTFRYVELTIETGDAPLTLHSLTSYYTGYPFTERAHFETPDLPDAQAFWEVGWRTARLCAHETYFDCPYYEQMQYVGDTRIQCLVSLYMSGDHRLFRNALSQLDNSRLSNGLTQSRYPARVVQVISPFSLWYVCMVADYYEHIPGDDAFIRSLIPGVRDVLGWFRARLRPDGLMGNLQFWNFVDWARVWQMGVPPGAADTDTEGGSSVVTLQYILALQAAAKLYAAFDSGDNLSVLENEIATLRKAVRETCFDAETSRVADTPEKASHSQHAAILAVLADALPADQQSAVMQRTVSDTALTQATFYFRFYLNRALVKAGLGDTYLDTLGPWRDMLKIGLTTWAENPEPTRSDCHAWSCSPNYEFLATVLGVRPSAPGFGKVVITPHLGALTSASGVVPHPQGEIRVSLRQEGNTLHADVTLPEGIEGTLEWRGESTPLWGGAQSVRVG